MIVCLGGCNPALAQSDPFVFGEDTCYLPCWHGIRPGETEKPEALTVIQNFEGITRYGEDGQLIYFSSVDKISNRLHIDSYQIVDWIKLELEPNELSQLIEKFGEPQYILFMIDSGGCIIDIYYPHKGLNFQGHCEPSITDDYWIVAKNTEMYSAYFTAQYEDIDEMLLLFFDETPLARTEDELRTWAGYGKYLINP
mgnify:CR=1 FL=1